jgi:Na+/melibiose symporter-like transporter
MYHDGDTTIKLTGKYSRTIQIFWSLLITVFAVVLITTLTSGNSQEWFVCVVVVYLIISVSMVALYAKSIHVEVCSGRLYIRQKRIDVTNRIKTVKRRSHNMATVRFNMLYQLNDTPVSTAFEQALTKTARYSKRSCREWMSICSGFDSCRKLMEKDQQRLVLLIEACR